MPRVFCDKIVRKCHITAHPSTAANQKQILGRKDSGDVRTDFLDQSTGNTRGKSNKYQPIYPKSTPERKGGHFIIDHNRGSINYSQDTELMQAF